MRRTGRADQCPEWGANGLNADVAFGPFMTDAVEKVVFSELGGSSEAGIIVF